MILRSFITVLLLLHPTQSFEHSIDLTKCSGWRAHNGQATGTDFCIVQETCTQGGGRKDENKIIELDAQSPMVENTECDIVVQIKVLSKTRMHVMMEIKGRKVKHDVGFALGQRELSQIFACKPGAVVTTRKQHKLLLDNHAKNIFKEDHMFCAFYAQFEKQEIVQLATEDAPGLYLTFTPDDGRESKLTETSENLNLFLKLMGKNCDYDKLTTTIEKSDDPEKVLTEVDIITNDFKCPDSAKLRLTKGSQQPTYPPFVKCDMRKFKFKHGDGDNDEISPQMPFKVQCEGKICHQCTVAPPLPPACKDCAQAEFTPKKTLESCPTLTCTKGKLTKDSKSFLEGELKCDLKSDPSQAGWFIGKEELTEVACTEKLQCPEIDNRFCAVGNQAACINASRHDSEVIECPAETSAGIIYGDILFKPGVKLECNTLTGIWEPSNEKGIKDGFYHCQGIPREGANSKVADASSGLMNVGIVAALFACLITGFVSAVMAFHFFKKSKEIEKRIAEEKQLNSAAQKKAVQSAEEIKSNRSKKKTDKDKLNLENFDEWDHEDFIKNILPNFHTAKIDARKRWLRNYFLRFNAYNNAKKIPESGTINQFCLLVKQCIDEKIDDAGTWEELYRVTSTIGYALNEKSSSMDDFHTLLKNPFESYFTQYFKECGFYLKKKEPRFETEMRLMCLEVLLSVRNPDIHENMRKMTFSEKLEVPLRMMAAAGYCRERDQHPEQVFSQYTKIVNDGVVDPHAAEGWGTYLQHCLYGLGARLITKEHTYQYMLFEAIYQHQFVEDPSAKRTFSPVDWLYAYRGAIIHHNSTRVAMECFKKHNSHSILHIETLLKQKCEDKDERETLRVTYQKAMKTYTQMLSDLIVGENEFNEFKNHLRVAIMFCGEVAKQDEPLTEERVRERAINLGNMVRDRSFVKECTDALKAIGATLNVQQ